MYCSEADILSRSDLVESGSQLQTAIGDAAAFVDGHLAGRYPLPLQRPPEILTTLNIDIALYYYQRDQAALTEDIRKRYEDAERYLTKVANGSIKLPGLTEEAKQSGPGAAYFSAKPRRFGR